MYLNFSQQCNYERVRGDIPKDTRDESHETSSSNGNSQGTLDVDAPDGQGRTALWHAVREGHFGSVVHLVERGGARVFYPNGTVRMRLN